MAATVVAPYQYYTHYSVDIAAGQLGVTGIIKYENTFGGGGASWPDRVDGGGVDSPTNTVINQVFPSDTPRTSALLLGLSYDGIEDPPLEVADFPGGILPTTGQHAVIFMSDAAFSALGGRSLDTLMQNFGYTDEYSMFHQYTEADLISWLETFTMLGEDAVGTPAFNVAGDHLDAFTSYMTTAIDGVNAWFAIPASQYVEAGTFKVVSFSDPNQVGSGTVTQDEVLRQSTVTPEPTSLALAGFAGIGMAVGAFRRRRQQKSAAA